MSVPVENANSVAWSPSRATRWLIPLGLALLGVICLVWVDAPVAGRFSQTPLDGELERLFDAAEHFGTPFGQILIALTIAAFASWWEPPPDADPHRGVRRGDHGERRQAPRGTPASLCL